MIRILVLIATLRYAQGNVPTFDEDTSGKQILFLPKDTPADTHIYRLKASDSDRDYPLTFSVSLKSPKDIVQIEQIGPQEADVVLVKQPIETGDMYVTNINVKDSSGQETEITFRINVTESRCSPDTVFVQYNKTYFVSEKSEVGKVIGHVLARSSDYINRDVDLQLLEGSDHFSLSPIWEKPKVIRGNIALTTTLDYEKQSFYSLKIAAYNGYVDRTADTRNIVYLQIFIIVIDEQDTPPIFTNIPTLVNLPGELQQNDLVMEVSAEDGDSAKRRPIQYSILPSPFSHYFRIDQSNGHVTSTVAGNEISKQGSTPITLTIQAEEVADNIGADEPTKSQKQVIIIPPDTARTAPTFSQTSYTAEIEEHAPQSTPIHINGETNVADEDQGLAGAVKLHLESDDGQHVEQILEIVPSVIVGHSSFHIIVKNPSLLDYEQFHSLKFKIVAEELAENPLKSTAEVILNLRDVNDNAPLFSKKIYEAQLPEDAKAGAEIIRLTAVDPDEGTFGQFNYVNISGEGSSKLILNKETGVITLATSNHGFDREVKDEYWFTITASDNGSPPRTNTTLLHLQLLDTNDNAPQFRHEIYERVLVPDLPLTGPVLEVEAIDADEPGSNNSMVRYELISGNWGEAFELDNVTGAITLKKTLSEASKDVTDDVSVMDRDEGVYTITIRAYDLGVPHQSSTATAYIYYKKPMAAMNVTIKYIYPSSVEDVNQDLDKMERMLTRLNGAPTSITGVQPYEEHIQKRQTGNVDKSLITTQVRYHKTSLVDLSAVARELNATNQVVIIDGSSNGGSTTGGNSGGSGSPAPMDEPSVSTAGASSEYGWKVALITLLVLLAIILLILLFFCLYRQFGRKMDERKVHPSEKQLDSSNSRAQVIEVATLERTSPRNGPDKAKVAVRNSDEDIENVVDTGRRRVYPNSEHPPHIERRLSAPQYSQQHGGPDPRVSYSRHLHRSDVTGNSVRVLHHHHHHNNPHQHHTMAEIEEEAGEEFRSSYYPMGEEVLMSMEPEWINSNEYVQTEYMEPYRRVWVKKYRGGGGSLPDKFAQHQPLPDDDERLYIERPKHKHRERGRAMTRTSFVDPTESFRPTERFIKLETGEILQLDDVHENNNFHSLDDAHENRGHNGSIMDAPINLVADSSIVSPQSLPIVNNKNNANNINIDNNNANEALPQPPTASKSKVARSKSKLKSESRYMDWYNNNVKSKEKHKSNNDKSDNENSVPNTANVADDDGKRKSSPITANNIDNKTIPAAVRANNAAALDVMEGEMRLGGNQSFDDQEEETDISGQTDSFKSSRKQFIEKKSLFTIAYNGMQTRQDALRERETSAKEERLTS
ncbi:hypothetical protein CHUAL_005437 [Chamberlinius hualienensis]